MNEAKIIKFGNIFEQENGTLTMSGFHIEGGERFKNERADVAVLTLIKERIEKEINELIKDK